MLIVNEIRVLYHNKEIYSIPFLNDYCRTDVISYNVVLLETNTGKTISVKASSERELFGELYKYRPYGFVTFPHGAFEGFEDFNLMTLSKTAVNFLGYVESIDVISRAELAKDISAGQPMYSHIVGDGFRAIYCFDPHRALLTVSLDEWEDNNYVEIACSLFDIASFTKNGWAKDALYVPVDTQGLINTDPTLDKAVAFRVTFSDIEKAKALTVRNKVLRTMLSDKSYIHGRKVSSFV